MLNLCALVFCLHVCLSVCAPCACLVPMEVRRRHWEGMQLQVAVTFLMGAPRIKSRSSTTTASALNHRAMALDIEMNFFIAYYQQMQNYFIYLCT